MEITTKKYACSRCGCVTEQATNHYGNTWNWGRSNCCPDCPPYAKYPELGGHTVWKCLEAEGKSETLLDEKCVDRLKPGDEVSASESFSSPPGIGVTVYRITRMDGTKLYGVQVGYSFQEFSGADME